MVPTLFVSVVSLTRKSLPPNKVKRALLGDLPSLTSDAVDGPKQHHGGVFKEAISLPIKWVGQKESWNRLSTTKMVCPNSLKLELYQLPVSNEPGVDLKQSSLAGGGWVGVANNTQ